MASVAFQRLEVVGNDFGVKEDAKDGVGELFESRQIEVSKGVAGESRRVPPYMQGNVTPVLLGLFGHADVQMENVRIVHVWRGDRHNPAEK